MAEESTGDAPAADLAARLATLPERVNGDPWLVRRGRFLTVEVLIELGRVPYRLIIERGRVASLEQGARPLRSWRVAFRAGEEVWRRFWRTEPAPQDHDLFALTKRGELRIEGDLQPFMANLFYFKDVLAAPRQRAGEG